MSHRKWLPQWHHLRHQERYFDGYEELGSATIRHSGSAILKKLENIQFIL